MTSLRVNAIASTALVSGLALLICIFCMSTSVAASFACSRATGIEKQICSDFELSRLDDELGIAYRLTLKSELKRAASIAGQRKWIAETRNKCEYKGCLSRVYKERISWLQGEMRWKGVSCGAEKSELIGDWARYKDGSSDFEAFTISLEDGHRSFTSWLHNMPEFIGSWDLTDCVLHLVNDHHKELDMDFTVLGLEKGILYLKDNGRGESSLYRKVRN
jgi:uncharacterized protein